MGKHLLSAALVWLLLNVAVASRAQTPPSPASQRPAQEEALAWDRDFDLLLELKATPTKAERTAEEEKAQLAKERVEVGEHLDDLKSRLAAIEGTYTSEALLNEMLRQGVADVQTAQGNLRKWIRKDEDRIREIDSELQRSAARAKG